MKATESRQMVSNVPRPDRTTKATLASAVGPVVYFVRCKDGNIKIGCTADLSKRRRQLGVAWPDVLAVQPGSFGDEHAWHVLLRAHRVRGREYFRPHADVIAVINEIRERLGVRAIT